MEETQTLNSLVKKHLADNPQSSKRSVMKKFHVSSERLETIIKEEKLVFKKQKSQWFKLAPLSMINSMHK